MERVVKILASILFSICVCSILFWLYKVFDSPFCKHHPGIVLVVIGFIGAFIFGHEASKALGKRLEWWFDMVLLVGLLLEMREAVNEDSQILTLQKQMQAMSTTVQIGFANVAPSNQPITSVEASVSFFVAGTNTEILDDDFLRDLRLQAARGESVEEIFGEGTELNFGFKNPNWPSWAMGRGFPLWLDCNKFSTSLGRATIWTGGGRAISFNLEFSLQPPEWELLGGSSRRQNAWKKYTVNSLESNNVAFLQTFFLKEDAKIVSGTCVLRINQDIKTFSLGNPAKPISPFDIIFWADTAPTNNQGK